MEKQTISRLFHGSVRGARSLSSVDQRSILGFLHLKELSAKATDVDTELVQVLRSDAIAYSTVTKNIRNDVIL
jgi:hypothetical protein